MKSELIVSQLKNFDLIYLSLIKYLCNKEDPIEITRTLLDLDFNLTDIEIIDNIFRLDDYQFQSQNEIWTFFQKIIVSQKDPLGVVFTPQEFSDFIVNRELSNHKDINSLIILDLASGGGNFYFSILKYIKNSFDQINWNLENVSKILNNLYAIEIDEKLIRLHKIRLYFFLRNNFNHKDTIQLINNSHIICGNALTLTSNLFQKSCIKDNSFDIIFSNPPYIGYRFISKSEKEVYAKRYSDIYTGLNDISYYFIYLGIILLKTNGKCIFLTSRYFLEARYANLLRKKILQYKVSEIIDLPNANIFGKGINSVIITIEKNKVTNHKIPILIIRDKTDNFNLIGLIEKETFLYQDQSNFDDKPWILIFNQENEIINYLEQNSTSLEKIAKLGTGFHTGLDKIFIENIHFNDGKYFGLSPDGEEVEIEREMVFKSIKTKQILPYFTEFNQHYVLLVYRDFEPKSYPKIMEYLHFYEKELKNRYDYKNNNIRWFEIAQIRNKDIFESKLKILCPYKAVEPRFALDTNQFITSIDISLILPLSIDPLLLLVYLNHPLVKQYIKLKAKKIDGRKVELYPEFLRHLPIKDFLLDKNPISNQIIQEMNKIENFCAPVSDITKSIISQCENLLNKLFKENGWKNE